MTDDEKLHTLKFEGKYSEYNIGISLNLKLRWQMTIKVKNTVTMELYEQSIDVAFLEEKPTLTCLVGAVNIFDYLLEHSDAIVIEGKTNILVFMGEGNQEVEENCH